MTTLLDAIEEIRKRPVTVLGHPSVRNLYAFVSGFTYARRHDGANDHALLAEFNRIVRRRYEISSAQGWEKIIEFYSVTEADELALFWKLWDEFLEQRSKGAPIRPLSAGRVSIESAPPRRRRRA